MADLSITAASVDAGTNATIIRNKDAGGTITAGQCVYLDGTTSTWLAADADTQITTDERIGIALHGSVSGQPLAVQVAGKMNLGATLSKGTVYVVSNGGDTGSAAGTIAPVADLASGDYLYILGYALATSGANSFEFLNRNTAITLA